MIGLPEDRIVRYDILEKASKCNHRWKYSNPSQLEAYCNLCGMRFTVDAVLKCAIDILYARYGGADCYDIQDELKELEQSIQIFYSPP